MFLSYAVLTASSTFPTQISNGLPSRLSGLAPSLPKRDKIQKWGWRPEYLWTAWNGWFDNLVGAFTCGGYCMVGGENKFSIVGRAISWLTLGTSLCNKNMAHTLIPVGSFFKKHSQEVIPDLSGSKKVFWLVLGNTKNFNNWYAPVFSTSGLTTKPRRGWATLPGPMGCKKINLFILAAALTAYRISLANNKAANHTRGLYNKNWTPSIPKGV